MDNTNPPVPPQFTPPQNPIPPAPQLPPVHSSKLPTVFLVILALVVIGY